MGGSRNPAGWRALKTGALAASALLAAALSSAPAALAQGGPGCDAGEIPMRYALPDSRAPALDRLFVSAVNEAMSGRLCLTPAAETPTREAALTALLNGRVDLVSAAPSDLAAVEPAFEIFDAPFLFLRLEAVSWFERAGPGNRMKLALREKGYVALAYWNLGMRQILGAASAETPEAAAALGLSTRTASRARATYRRLGAEGGRVARGAQAAALSWSEMAASGALDRLRVATETNHAPAIEVLATSRRFWSALPRQTRVALNQAVSSAAREIAREARARETDGRALVAAAGVEIRALRPEERTAWTEALAPALSERTKVIGAGYVDAALRSNQ